MQVHSRYCQACIVHVFKCRREKITANFMAHNMADAAKTEPPYTIFTHGRRLLLLVLLSLVGFWSAISNSIYYPALPVISQEFHETSEMVNLSLVAYLLCQGIAPTFTSNFADSFGRRPTIVACFLVYIGACVGLSQARAYWVFLLLRCVQAGGIAPVIAINAGISGDVCTPADRGGFVGIVTGTLLVGQAFGSLLGSAILSRWSWPAIFAFLAIGSGATLVLLLFSLTETCRAIVGNGSVWPGFLHRAPVLYLPSFRRHMNHATHTKTAHRPVELAAPFLVFSSFRSSAALVTAGVQFSAWTMSLTTLSTELETRFGYSKLHTGLMYLPQGLCCLVASFGTGQALNVYYKFRKSRAGDGGFDRVRARLDCSVLPLVFSVVGLLLFGWALQSARNVASAVVGTCFLSLGSACIIAIVTTMMVDLRPENGSAATSAVNLVRCSMAAVGVAVLDYMVRRMGVGGCYSFMAGLCVASAMLLVFAVYRHNREERVKDRLDNESMAME
ncbi:hypothetical protein CLUG_05479 [Clavispora lusitaniae ATCC 42720]|uniref:Major facilitator superfamily (MFS) profile domain-containing protein n=1 Tax=Clavispora lusitaniae (strain ATCC 42720) TaxID=306902 RepID=C4YBA1_CLAL4|nr:uncharacterized protein CLUG_05479 [Clavispora lusitaniae ATCC 42720]EEQ41351.1 hypothetical protein CLUG_05479 [Clavispora lusitaniae ATCC 42720]